MSELERSFETIWKQLGGMELQKEYKFHTSRKWRFDFAFPQLKIGIEIEGGLYSKGRHTRAQGYTNDCEKYNQATLLGWQVYRLTSLMFDDPFRYIDPLVKHINETNIPEQ